jgi:hypothetical protein
LNDGRVFVAVVFLHGLVVFALAGLVRPHPLRVVMAPSVTVSLVPDQPIALEPQAATLADRISSAEREIRKAPPVSPQNASRTPAPSVPPAASALQPGSPSVPAADPTPVALPTEASVPGVKHAPTPKPAPAVAPPAPKQAPVAAPIAAPVAEPQPQSNPTPGPVPVAKPVPPAPPARPVRAVRAVPAAQPIDSAAPAAVAVAPATDKLPAPVRPQPALDAAAIARTLQAARPAPDRPSFRGSDIAAMIAKSMPTGAARLNVVQMSALQDAIRSQLTPCWNLPTRPVDAAPVIVLLRIQLRNDGSLLVPPEILSIAGVGASNTAYGRAVANSARRAVTLCSPLKLPLNLYDAWRDVEINFDPSQLF